MLRTSSFRSRVTTPLSVLARPSTRFCASSGIGGWRVDARKQLHHHVDADRMNVGAEAFRLIQATVGPNKIQHPQERFLANIVNQLPGTQAVAHGEPDHVAEMRDEMPLRLRIAIAEP